MDALLLYLISFACTCASFVFATFLLVVYLQFLCPRETKKIVLKRKPVEIPEGIEEGVESAEWANATIDQIFYAAGGLKLVELLHMAFVTAMEQRSSIISTSELKLLVEGLVVKDFRLGKRLPRVKNILSKTLGQDFALVFDVEFENGNMITELGAKMGLGLQEVAAKLAVSRFVGKSVVKFEMLPNPRVSLLSTALPLFRLFVTYGKNPMPRLSSLLELVIQSVFKSKFLYPQYQTLLLNLGASSLESLTFLSPANISQSILRIGSVKATIDNELLNDCNALQFSVHVGPQKFKSSTISSPFLPNNINWKLSHTFNILPNNEAETEVSFRLINRKKILGSEVIGGSIIPLSSIPPDSHETLKIKPREGIVLEIEVFHAMIAQSGFADREWIFWNSSPPLPAKEEKEDEDEIPSLDKLNWNTIKFAIQRLLTKNLPSEKEDEEDLDIVVLNLKTDEDAKQGSSTELEIFYHAAQAFLLAKTPIIFSKSSENIHRKSTLSRQSSWPNLVAQNSCHELLLIMLLVEVPYDLLHFIVFYNRSRFEDMVYEIEDRYLFFALSSLLDSVPLQNLSTTSRSSLKSQEEFSSLIPKHSCFILPNFLINLRNEDLEVTRRSTITVSCIARIGGKDVHIEGVAGFLSWYSKGDSIFPLLLINLKHLVEVQYTSISTPFFTNSQAVSTQTEKLNLNILDKVYMIEGDSLFNLYFYLQNFFVEHKTISIETPAYLDQAQNLIFAKELILKECPLELFMQLPNRKVMYDKVETILCLKQEICKEEDVRFSFEGSFLSKGLVRGKFTILQEVVLFKGLQNRYRYVDLIIPLESIIAIEVDSRMFLGNGVRIGFMFNNRIVELFVFSSSCCREDIVNWLTFNRSN